MTDLVTGKQGSCTKCRARCTDTFGSYDPDAALKENKRPRASSAMGGERVRQQVSSDRHTVRPRELNCAPQMEDMKHRLQTQHDKDLDKLQSKIARLELSRDEAVKDKSENTNEILGLKAVIRTWAQTPQDTTANPLRAVQAHSLQISPRPRPSLPKPRHPSRSTPVFCLNSRASSRHCRHPMLTRVNERTSKLTTSGRSSPLERTS